MNLTFHAIAQMKVIRIVPFLFINCVGLQILAAASDEKSAYSEVVLRLGETSCVYHEPKAPQNEWLRIGNIGDLAYNSPGAIVWKSFVDGKIRSRSGLCLVAGKTDLQLKNCSTYPNEHDKWNINSEGLLRSGTSCVSRSPQPERLVLSDCEVSNKSLFVRVELNDQNALLLNEAAYARTAISDNTVFAFKQLRAFGSGISEKLKDLYEIVASVTNEDSKIDATSEQAQALIQELQKNSRRIENIDQYGSGTLIEVYETEAPEPVVSFVTNGFTVSEDVLERYGINSRTGSTVKAKALILPPSDGYYSFVLRNITSSISIQVGDSILLNAPFAPLGGVIVSSPTYLSKTEKIPVVVTSSSNYRTPTFVLGWKSLMQSEEPIPSLFLSPTVDTERRTKGSFQPFSCTQTFEALPGDGSFQVHCPPGCVAENVESYGNSGCFALSSSVCYSAVVSGIVPEKGGVVSVVKDSSQEQYEHAAATGFNGFTTKSSSGPRGCARIMSHKSDQAFYDAITDVKLIEKNTFLSSSNNTKSYSGYEGYISHNTDIVLLTKRAGDPQFIADIRMSCGDISKMEGAELVSGAEVNLFVKKSRNRKGIAVQEAYISANEEFQPSLSFNDFSRQTCKVSSGYLHLYVKYVQLPSVMEFPSLSLTCEDTFETKSVQHRAASVFTVRCPPGCGAWNVPVIGLYLYNTESGICRSAIHAGVISDLEGGLVQISKADGLKAVVRSTSVRNGVMSTTTSNPSAAFYVSQPRGYPCAYPQGGYLERIVVSPSIPGSSFLETFMSLAPAAKTVAIRTLQADTMETQRHDDANASHIFNNQTTNATDANSIRLRDILEQQANQLRFLQEKTLNLGERFDDSSSAISSLHGQLSSTREKQRNRDSKRQVYISQLSSLQASIASKGTELSDRIAYLEKLIAEPTVLHSKLIKETFPNLNLNSRYTTIDAVDADDAPSLWSIEKDQPAEYTISQTYPAHSATSLGSMAISRNNLMAKGFVYANILVPARASGSAGLILKFVNQLNFVAFEVNPAGTVYFREMTNGFMSAPCGEVKYPVATGAWMRLGADFGLRNMRGFVDGVLVTGCKSQSVIRTGSVGMATNIASGDAKVRFRQFMSGPLEDEDKVPDLGSRPPSSIAEDEHHDGVSAAIKAHKAASSIEPLVANFGKANETQELNSNNSTVGLLTEYLSKSWNIQPGSSWFTNADSVEDFLSGSLKEDSSIPTAIFLKNLDLEYNRVEIGLAIRINHGSRAGVVLRATDPETFYAVVIDEFTRNPALLSALKIISGRPYILSASTSQTLESGNWYNVTIQDIGEKIIVKLNGEIVIEETVENSKPRGQLGLLVLNGNADFKDIAVTGLSK